MKKIFTFLFFSLMLAKLSAQTHVSGGIYNNTTWTVANSPYIVDSLVVVFPGVTLTIEPGVTVKFEDGQSIELRGNLFAQGTVSDSITFTSNSLTPSPGIWPGGLYADTAEYWNLLYASVGTSAPLIKHSTFSYNTIATTGGAILVDSCTFSNNQGGILNQNSSKITNCDFINNTWYGVKGAWNNVDHCRFINNAKGIEYESNYWTSVKNSVFCGNYQYGIFGFMNSPDTVVNCSFSNNGIGINGNFHLLANNIISDNDIGLIFTIGPTDSIYNNFIFHNNTGVQAGGTTSPNYFNNSICNNNDYNIRYVFSTNGVFPPTCFCDTDSATIAAKIYDGYDDISLGLLDYTPFILCDSSVLAGISPVNCPAITTGFSETPKPESGIIIFPNPATNQFTITSTFAIKEITIYNVLGEKVYSKKLTIDKGQMTIDASKFGKGIYFVRVDDGEKWVVRKLVVE